MEFRTFVVAKRSKYMFCENCGIQMKDGVKFCAKCGNRVTESQLLPLSTAVKASDNTHVNVVSPQPVPLDAWMAKVVPQLSFFISKLKKIGNIPVPCRRKEKVAGNRDKILKYGFGIF